MSTLMRILSVAAVCAMSAAARGQFGPPTPTPATGDAGTSAASPGGGGSLNIGPPQAVADPNGGAGVVGSTKDGGPLMPVRTNQPMTTNAMIGFVNDEPVFLTDLFRPIDEDLRRLAATSKTLADFKQGASTLISSQLTQRVSESLVVAAAEAQLTDNDRQRVAIYLALERSKLIADHGGSVPAADRALSAVGSSVDKEMADRRRRVIKDFYFQKNLVPHIVITRQMVIDAYAKDPKKWQQVAQVEMYTITLPITRWLRGPTVGGRLGDILPNPTAAQIQAAETQALAAGREIVTALKAGADFATLVEDKDSRDAARTHGGRTASVTRGSMVNTRLEDYVFSLPADTLGEPQLMRETDFRDTTVVVVRIGKKSEARTVPFAEAQSALSQELKQAQLRDLQSQEMEKLSKGAAIEAVERMRGVALDAAVTRYAMN